MTIRDPWKLDSQDAQRRGEQVQFRSASNRKKREPMKFQVSRASQGVVSRFPPLRGAVRGPRGRKPGPESTSGSSRWTPWRT